MTYPARRPPGLTLVEAFSWYPPVPTGGCLLWPAGTIGGGYGCFRLNYQLYTAHVVAYELANGPVPAGHVVDHIDCVSRRCIDHTHLRAATRKQNVENKHVLPAHNTSGVMGVSWHKATGMWTARVCHGGRVTAAYFRQIEDAEGWVLAKRIELFSFNEADRQKALVVQQ
jgi:hypothetical protein